jgi:IS5 family transposase
MEDELVQLARKIDWDWMTARSRRSTARIGRPRIKTRFVIGPLLLKHIYGPPDEGICERWIHAPYFQFFTGEEVLKHAFTRQ